MMHRRTFLQLGAYGFAAACLPLSAAAAAPETAVLPKALRGNPLLDFAGLPRWKSIRAAHIAPALEYVLAQNRRTIEKLSAQKNPDWQNFYLPLAVWGLRLEHVYGAASHLNSVNNTGEIRKAFEAAQKRYTEFRNWADMHQGLYRAYQKLAARAESGGYADEQKKAVEFALLDFKLSGVDKPEATRKRLAALNKRLAQLSLRFSNQVQDAKSAWEKYVDTPEALSGLSAQVLKAAQESAAAKGKKGYRLTLDLPVYLAVMSHADKAELREEMYRAYMTRASDQGPFANRWDNGPVIDEILRLRSEYARLLGFPTYAHYALARRMLTRPQQVMDFLNGITAKVRPHALRETEELQQYAAKKYGAGRLNVWDYAYYSEKLKQERYSVDSEALRAYFPEERVKQGLFETARRLFGITVKKQQSPDVWHESVEFYHLHDRTGTHIGSFYFDLYTREHKNGGAWQNSLVSRDRDASGRLRLPVSVIVCNFNRPTGDGKSLLKHDEAVTLFHEFGHGLQHMLTRVDTAAVSGLNNVPWDAVEFVSQLLENWCWQPEGIGLISAHHETGAPLPSETLKQMIAAKNFLEGRRMLRQLEYGLLDFRTHLEYRPGGRRFIRSINSDIQQKVAAVPEPEWARRPEGFTHIFAGGYAAGYYSYMWSDVMAADAFTRFEKEGIFNPATGAALADSVLAWGGVYTPMALFVRFMGREPDPQALLKHSGL